MSRNSGKDVLAHSIHLSLSMLSKAKHPCRMSVTSGDFYKDLAFGYNLPACACVDTEERGYKIQFYKRELFESKKRSLFFFFILLEIIENYFVKKLTRLRTCVKKCTRCLDRHRCKCTVCYLS